MKLDRRFVEDISMSQLFSTPKTGDFPQYSLSSVPFWSNDLECEDPNNICVYFDSQLFPTKVIVSEEILTSSMWEAISLTMGSIGLVATAFGFLYPRASTVDSPRFFFWAHPDFSHAHESTFVRVPSKRTQKKTTKVKVSKPKTKKQNYANASIEDLTLLVQGKD
jgi:hypothetical protein